MYIDKASGKDFNRPKYQLLKQLVRKDDTIVFDSITRMGRNMDETLKEYEWFNGKRSASTIHKRTNDQYE
ncbi:recombinase family protein [Bacillus paranthracis]